MKRIKGIPILVELSKGPKTYEDLEIACGTTREAVDRWIKDLTSAGLVRFAGFAPSSRPGPRPSLWEWTK